MSREQTRQNSFFGGAAILAVGIALVKVIGAIFKIPIVRILGEASYADFSNAYYIYSILLTVSTAGLSVALSKMVAASHAVEQDGQVRKVFRVSLTVFFVLGFGSFLLMFFGNVFLADRMNDTQAAAAIRYLAPAVVCVSLLSSFRGYAQGHSYMVPSAVSQVIEALGKLLIGLPLAYLAVEAGKGEDLCAAYAILGVTVGEALALVYMVLEYLRNRPTGRPLMPAMSSSGSILRELMVIAIPITLTSSAVSVINTIDASVVQGQLQNALGMAEEQSRTLFGAYSGVQNIYNLPASFIIAVTASVIPNVSAAMAQGRQKEAGRVVKAAFHVTALLVFPMGVGMSVLAEPIVRLLFKPQGPGPVRRTAGDPGHCVHLCVHGVGVQRGAPGLWLPAPAHWRDGGGGERYAPHRLQSGGGALHQHLRLPHWHPLLLHHCRGGGLFPHPSADPEPTPVL